MNCITQSVIGPVMLALAMTAPATRAADGPDVWRRVTTDALLATLRTSYPDVVDWDVRELVGRRQTQRLERVAAGDARVVHVGKRSAVRLVWNEATMPVDTIVWFDVVGTADVLTTTADVRQREALSPQRVQAERRDIFNLGCKPVKSPDAVRGMRAIRSMRSGDVLCADQMESLPAVSRGEQVVVQSVVGAVAIRTVGVAEQDGALGARVRIRNPATSDTYIASVSGPGEVFVHE